MRTALALGRRGLGRVAPNPAVGCVIVRDGRIVGRGITQLGGRPHAETEALRQAGGEARGATAYVTLEPCSNYGRTPPCAAALIEAGIARVVVACVDPDPRVDGRGLTWLREAGIEVVLGCLEEEARADHLGLYRRIKDRRPMISLKVAASLDGGIAAASGASRWITGPEARAFGHLLRAQHDAVLVGSGTVLADDPLLDCRLPGLATATGIRIVLDRRLRTVQQAKLLESASPSMPVLLIVGRSALAAARTAVERPGLEILPVNDEAQPREILGLLAERGLTRILVEGGAHLATSLLRDDLVDRLYWFTAPIVLGGDALPAVAALGINAPADAARWMPIELRALGQDRLLVLKPSANRD